MIDMQKKIKMALTYADMNQAELAEAIGTSKQNLHSKLGTGKMSAGELEKIAEAMGATYNVYFEFPDGTRV